MNFGDWTRQTRWAHPPDPAPAGVSPGGIYVRQFTWAICPHCGGEIDWRERAAIAERNGPNQDLYPLPNDTEENDR